MAPLTAGAAIGQYTISKLIGEGSMGSVYEAVSQSTGQHVAIKMLHSDYAGDVSLIERFEREILVLRALNHPHIVPCIDYGEHDGRAYFVMTLIKGTSLATWLNSRFFSPMEMLAILQPICRALDYAHSLNVIHRDVKPSNILIDVTGGHPSLYLSDFGLSKVIDMVSLTESQMQVGTPNYMSPEQAEDLPLTPATDVYALTVIAYELLLRQLPFDADTDFAMALAHVQTPPRPPSQIAPSFPPVLEVVLMKGLVKDPVQRYPSAGAFFAALREAVMSLDEGTRTSVFRFA